MKETVKKYIAENLGIDDESTFNMLYDSYKETVTESIDKIYKAISNRSSEELRAAAHALKGCSANIGAEPIRAASYDLEMSAKSSDFDKASGLFDTIKNLSAEL